MTAGISDVTVQVTKVVRDVLSLLRIDRPLILQDRQGYSLEWTKSSRWIYKSLKLSYCSTALMRTGSISLTEKRDPLVAHRRR